MTPAANAIAQEAANWIRTNLDRVQFGELSLTIRLHAGRPPIVEHGIIERVLHDDLTTGKPGANHDRRR